MLPLWLSPVVLAAASLAAAQGSNVTAPVCTLIFNLHSISLPPKTFLTESLIVRQFYKLKWSLVRPRLRTVSSTLPLTMDKWRWRLGERVRQSTGFR